MKHFINSCFIILSTTASLVHAVDPKPAICSNSHYRAFDFWVGQWTVATKNQTTAPAKSSITLANKGCSIHENYQTARGYTGNSISFYDKNTHLWHQTWIDNQGSPLYLEGGLQQGAMVLSDHSNRITWTVLKNKQVNQVWEITKDKGKTWKVVFNGFYTKIRS